MTATALALIIFSVAIAALTGMDALERRFRRARSEARFY